MKRTLPPLKELNPLEYCYLMWAGKEVIRTKDGKNYEMWMRKGKYWSGGEGGSVSYWCSGISSSEEFHKWEQKIKKIKASMNLKWFSKVNKHV